MLKAPPNDSSCVEALNTHNCSAPLIDDYSLDNNDYSLDSNAS